MIDPLSRRDYGARDRFALGGGATITAAPVAFAAFLYRWALQRADRAYALGHLSTPARRSIWARISSI